MFVEQILQLDKKPVKSTWSRRARSSGDGAACDQGTIIDNMQQSLQINGAQDASPMHVRTCTACASLVALPAPATGAGGIVMVTVVVTGEWSSSWSGAERLMAVSARAERLCQHMHAWFRVFSVVRTSLCGTVSFT